MGSSPHTRGAPSKDSGTASNQGIIPAYAGSTPSARDCPSPRGDHPRIRGEHWRRFLDCLAFQGSSPHTRGALPLADQDFPLRRIIPAYAGSTQDGFTYMPEAGGSSPHTRGAPQAPAPRRPGMGIIPAYAGSTWRHHAMRGAFSDHPRIRGEHRKQLNQTLYEVGSSPHTRGALNGANIGYKARRIIPAYAGSTLGNPCNTKDRRRDYTSFPLPVTHPSGGGGS